MTDKSTLNLWFQTEKKPTQAQFWAWQDSYWHKSDTIPADRIENLATTLANKAETSSLANYAKKDAANLGDTDKTAWKTALGIVPLPTNLATIDPTMVNYVMMKDGTTNFAGDLGKNVGNSAVTSVANAGLTLGANWTLNANNFGLYITGLADKSSDSTFSKILVEDSAGKVAQSNGKAPLENLLGILDYNKDANGNYIPGFDEYFCFNKATGKLAKTDRPQVVTTNNFPSNVTVNYTNSIQNSNYVPNPQTPTDIADTYAIVNHIEDAHQFTKFLTGEILVQKMPTNKFPAALQGNYQIPDLFDILDGAITTKATAPANYFPPNEFFSFQYVSSMENSDIILRILLNKPMPTNKDWIVKVRFYGSAGGWGLGHPFNSVLGFVPTNNPDDMDYRPQKDWKNWAQNNFQKAGAATNIPGQLSLTTVYFIRKGSKLSVLVYSEVSGSTTLNIYDYDSTNDIYFRFGWVLDSIGWSGFGISHTSIKDISYWIQP